MCEIFPADLPEHIRNNIKSSGEIKVFDEIKSQLDHRWTVFYNVAWLGQVRGDSPTDGETDFIVCHPEMGVLLVEVKGGRIGFQGSHRQWHSTDRHGNSYPIDPFKQVLKSKYALLNKLKTLKAWQNEWIELYHCVAFPDSLKPEGEVSPDSPPAIIIDAEDIRNLEKSFKDIFSYWNRGRKSKGMDCNRLIRQLTDMLACDYDLKNPLYYQALEEEKKIIHLTEEQFNILSLTSRIPRAAVGGCAGSGKTLLAVEKALRLSRQGMRTLLTCYNKGLGNFLANILKDRENLEVVHFHHLCHTYAEKAGIELTCNYENPDFFGVELPEALCRAVEKDQSLKFDALVVDEGQDFRELWWLALSECLKSPSDGIFYIFYDDNQNIYQGAESFFKDFSPFSLHQNIRNTRHIFRMMKKYYRSRESLQCRGPEGRPIEVLPYSGAREMKRNLSRVIHRLIVEEKFPPEDISVLCIKSIKPDSYSNVKDGDVTGNFVLKTNPEAHNHIYLSTVYSFKGLENRVVIITDIGRHHVENPDKYDSLFYVGASRARNHLILMCEDKAVEFFSLSPDDGVEDQYENPVAEQ